MLAAESADELAPGGDDLAPEQTMHGTDEVDGSVEEGELDAGTVTSAAGALVRAPSCRQ